METIDRGAATVQVAAMIGSLFENSLQNPGAVPASLEGVISHFPESTCPAQSSGKWARSGSTAYYILLGLPRFPSATITRHLLCYAIL